MPEHLNGHNDPNVADNISADSFGAAVVVKRGRDALKRIANYHQYQHKLFADWLRVGEAIVAGRAQCIEKTGADPRKGGRMGSAYNRAFGYWLKANHLAEDDGLTAR